MVFCYHDFFVPKHNCILFTDEPEDEKRCVAVLLKYLNSLLVLVVLAFGLCLFSLGDSRVVSGY
jgi:hypothetical protein